MGGRQWYSRFLIIKHDDDDDDAATKLIGCSGLGWVRPTGEVSSPVALHQNVFFGSMERTNGSIIIYGLVDAREYYYYPCRMP